MSAFDYIGERCYTKTGTDGKRTQTAVATITEGEFGRPTILVDPDMMDELMTAAGYTIEPKP